MSGGRTLAAVKSRRPAPLVAATGRLTMNELPSKASPTVPIPKPQRKYIPASEAVGKRFGRLVVLRIFYPSVHAKAECQCDCGSRTVANVNSLRTGVTKSCGCWRMVARRTHGGSGSRLYKVWTSMIQRCTNPNDQRWKDYGGRGISVCARWEDAFEAFVNDMGPCFPGGTVERINNDGNYEPSNCRWATKKEQARNTRRNHWVEHNGERMILQEFRDLQMSTIRDKLLPE